MKKTDFRRETKTLLFDTECFKGDVEILTEDGFVRFDQLGDERVAQYNEDGSVEFVKPVRKIKKWYKGNGVEFSTKKGGLRLTVTANHTMISRTKKGHKIVQTLAKDYGDTKGHLMVFAGKNKKSRPLRPEDQMAIALQADGSLKRQDINKPQWGKKWNRWDVHLKKARKIERFEKIISQLDWRWNRCRLKNGDTVFYGYTPSNMTKDLSSWFRIEECGEDFLQEVKYWDGSVESLKSNKERVRYYSCDIQNINFVAAVAACNNHRISRSVRRGSTKPVYVLNIGAKYEACLDKVLHSQKIILDGLVYCVEVPSHMIIVRGGERALVVGNCSPSRGWFYGQYETNPIKVEQPPILLAVSWKWLGDKGKAQGATLFDFPQKDRWDDDGLVRKLWSLMDEANVIVAHNLRHFDEKMANGFFLRHGLTPPSPSKPVDTLQVARRYFKLDNNRLDYLGKLLFGGGKTEVTYKDCWDKMLNGSEKEAKRYAKLMDSYCRNDTDLLEKVYNKMLPWDRTHPNMALFAEREACCPKCGYQAGFKVKSYRRTGMQINAIQYQCNHCHGYVTRKLDKEERDELREQGRLTSVFRNVI